MDATEMIERARALQFSDWNWNSGKIENAQTLLQPMADALERYRDAFSEITAKAIPFLSDGDRILSYVVPCGPIHRAAGKLNHQMFDGEAHMRAAIARIAELEAELKRKE